MAQVNKLQQGTGAGGIQPKKLSFTINGNAYDKDEQFVKDQFTPIFSELVASGNAKERDRDLWQKSFSTYLNQARTGSYAIETSGDQFLSGKYTGAAGAETGLDADGNTARKTQVGEILSPRQRDDHQRMSMLNGMIGSRLGQAYNTDTAAAKAKLDADGLKAKDDKKKKVLSTLANFSKGFGFNKYGEDYNTAKDVVMDSYWDNKTTDTQRKALLGGVQLGGLKSIFSTDLDEFKDDDDLKKLLNNRSLDDVRNLASKVYDPTTGTSKIKFNTLKDFQQLSNVYDTMGADAAFYDRNAYLASKNGGTTPTAGGGTGSGGSTTPTTPTKQPGKSYSKDGKTLLNGLVNGTLYHNGEIFQGAYVGQDEGGRRNYYSDTSGYYKDGKRVSKGEYIDWYRALEKQGTKTLAMRKVLAQRDQFQKDLWRGKTGQRDEQGNPYEGGGTGDDTHFVRFDEIMDKDASDFILGDYVKGNKVTSAQNISANFPGFPGAIATVRDDNRTDSFGNRFVENVVKLKGGKSYKGKLKKDYATGRFRFYDAMGAPVDEVNKHLENIDYAPQAENVKHFRYNYETGKSGATYKPVVGSSHTYLNKEGGVLENVINKYQIGGKFVGSAYQAKSPENRGQAKVSDIGTALTHDNYKLSNLDKWELGALAADLTGTIASFTGAGSVVSGTLGVGSTLTQLGTDVARDGWDMGDISRAGIGLALDAASFVPGLGAASSTSKTIRTLTKVAKYVVPALTAAGLLNAAGTLRDVVSGKKAMSDLSVDDLRSIVGGIHSVVGGTRMLNQKLATTKNEAKYITLKGGVKHEISAQQARQLEDATDKIDMAKKIVQQNKGKANIALEDIELGDTKTWSWRAPKSGFRKTKTDSNTEIGTGLLDKSAPYKLKSLDDYQGNGVWDRWMRGNITRAAKRDASMDLANVNNDLNPAGRTGTKNATFGFWGDMLNRRPKRSLLELPEPSGEPLMGNNTRWLEQNARPSNGFVKFKDGGILKMQSGYKGIPYRLDQVSTGTPYLSAMNPAEPTALDEWNFAMDKMANGTMLKQSATPQLTPAYSKAPIFNKIVLPGQTVNQVYGAKKSASVNLGADSNTPRVGLGKRLISMSKTIDPLAASELGRALYTRELNSRIDTKVERPMMTAPAEVAVPVRGNLLATQASNQQANNVLLGANQNRTSDAMLNTAANLSANQQAAGLRLQGDMMNVEALERTRAASMQNDMQNAKVRAEVANNNVQTNARATQAERAAGNEKMARMAQPIVDYWKDQNYKAQVEREQNRSVEGQLFQLGEQTKLQPLMQSLETRNNAIDVQLSNPNLDVATKQKLIAEQQQLSQQWQSYSSKLQEAMLNYRKDPTFKTGNTYYTTPRPTPAQAQLGVAIKKEGGEVKMAVEQQKQEGYKSRAIAKEHASFLKEGLEDDSKKSIANMRQIQELIKLALS